MSPRVLYYICDYVRSNAGSVPVIKRDWTIENFLLGRGAPESVHELAGFIFGTRSSAAHDKISPMENDLSESSRINTIILYKTDHFDAQQSYAIQNKKLG